MLYSVKLQALTPKFLIFRTANVKNKFTRQNNRFGPADKKAIFGPYFQEKHAA
jgi:hypothetical protein